DGLFRELAKVPVPGTSLAKLDGGPVEPERPRPPEIGSGFRLGQLRHVLETLPAVSVMRDGQVFLIPGPDQHQADAARRRQPQADPDEESAAYQEGGQDEKDADFA